MQPSMLPGYGDAARTTVNVNNMNQLVSDDDFKDKPYFKYQCSYYVIPNGKWTKEKDYAIGKYVNQCESYDFASEYLPIDDKRLHVCLIDTNVKLTYENVDWDKLEDLFEGSEDEKHVAASVDYHANAPV